MNKKIFVFAISFLSIMAQAQRKPFVAPPIKPKTNTTASSTTQTPSTTKVKKKETKPSAFAAPSRDYVMLQFAYENWAGAPDSIQISGLGRAFNAYVCYDFPIKKSNFSFAAGIGVSSSNIYLKNQAIVLTDTTEAVRFIPEPLDYKKYKFNTTFIEAPFEFRYFSNSLNRNRGFKAAIGLKVGALVSAHAKSKRGVEGKPIVEKVSTKRYLENYRYSATLRLGYGNFSIFGQYALSNVFKINNGPENIRPYQIGLCISGL
jgi:hypothetical protein